MVTPDIATHGLPAGFQEALPATQAATLALLTWVQEDIPTVGAALLAAVGALSWQAGFAGCFLGIWIGDLLLYLAARGFGRPLLEHRWVRRWVGPESVARSEAWFARRGTGLLVSSRFLPGTRLPTYLAAGFLRHPFGSFAAVTGLMAALWTAAIFVVARVLGERALEVFATLRAGAWSVPLTILAGIVVFRLAVRLASREGRRRLGAAVVRWSRWEFWPAWLFYLPVGVNYLRLAIRHRGLTVPTAANPGIFSGGFVGESKIVTLRQLTSTSPEFTARAHLLAEGTLEERRSALARLREQEGIQLPFILKPDVGQRGAGVKLIRTDAQADACLRQTGAPLLVQEYAPGPFEAGVFYHRAPGEARGRIFAITEKVFPHLTGDGASTVAELVWRDPRARLLADRYLQRLGPRAGEIPAPGERIRLVEAGNHAQGCIFRDGARWHSPELERCIDAISQRLDGFFVGRYDLRFASEDDLRAGRNFQIVELNGAAAEATSIYDANNSLIPAYRTLFRQWELVFAIGAANRRLGVHPTPPGVLWRAWRAGVARAREYPPAD